MTELPDPILKKHGRFLVLRDDLIEGGSKRRVLKKVLKDIEEDEIVYPGHPYGQAAYALGLVAQEYKKKVRLLFPIPKIDHPTLQKSIQLPNVQVEFKPVEHQHELLPLAQKYATENKAHLMPIGFNTPQFFKELVCLAQSLKIKPKEIWCLAGSGLLCRALCKAFEAKICAVNLGMPHLQVDPKRVRVFDAPEKPEEMAKNPPPYPSSPHYDAKIWQFAQKHGSKGALIWNVGA